jgi:hypothetical protein
MKEWPAATVRREVRSRRSAHSGAVVSSRSAADQDPGGAGAPLISSRPAWATSTLMSPLWVVEGDVESRPHRVQ